jgi:hypothetical protein
VTNLRRSTCRLSASRDPTYGVGDNIHRRPGTRYDAFCAVGLFVLLFVCGCVTDSPKPTCLNLDSACAAAVAQNLSQITHEPQVCNYVEDQTQVATSRKMECLNPYKSYEGVTLVQVGENGNWNSQVTRLPGKVYRIVFLEGCVKDAMC